MARGGYAALQQDPRRRRRRCPGMTPDQVIAEVKLSRAARPRRRGLSRPG
ncbi:MAG: hypothetical protein MZW92_33445 [Comamonadaceae bacterium]|nr:hypothetical protein [Comamonadaceae bacterium]